MLTFIESPVKVQVGKVKTFENGHRAVILNLSKNERQQPLTMSQYRMLDQTVLYETMLVIA